MKSKHAGWISSLGALSLVLAGCSSGGGEGSSFFVESCSLGCSNGAVGTQISCGVVGVAENQEVALLFSSPVGAQTVTKESFQVNHSITGAAAAGTRFVDPLNPNRLIFRPKLTVGPTGNTIFGFEQGASYLIRINGTNQNDPSPFVQNTSGRANSARVSCTITANLGVVDPIKGKPRVTLGVEIVDPSSGATSNVEVLQGLTPGAENVKTLSAATLKFDELMNISTLVNPSTGKSPTIAVVVDVDGNPNTVQDRTPVDGSFAYGLDQVAQTTTVVFTPKLGFPSSGNDPGNPRLILITIAGSVTDIAGSVLENPGSFNFVPQFISFPAVTLPPGGEQFTDSANLDPEISGSDWGTSTLGRLTPGEGGGSGRLGSLHVGPGEIVVLHSTPGTGTATVQFLKQPANKDEVVLAGVTFTFKTTATLPTEIPLRTSLAFNVSSLVDVVNLYSTNNPLSPVAAGKLTQADYDILLIEAVTAGTTTVPYTLQVIQFDALSLTQLASLSSPFLVGGFDTDSYSSPNTITNFNFDPNAGGTPGGIPPDLVVINGVYEFGDILIEATGQLILAGDLPVQLLARGDFTLQDQAIIDISGGAPGSHNSSSSYGQPGGQAGVGAGDGGRGGDRSSSPGLLGVFGVTLASSVLDGSPAEGVGGVPGVGQGLGGDHWPLLFPTAITAFADWAYVQQCISCQVANTGSGGAYAVDGFRGFAKAVAPTATNSAMATVSNLPAAQTGGGDALAIGLEPPSANPTMQRLLSPGLGYLRGGAGGGGGGAHLAGTSIVFFGTPCFTSQIGSFFDNSGAAGGGGGGALQVQAGREANLLGSIDAGGGAGGSATTVVGLGSRAAPGGGGAGGAVLLQGGLLNLSNSPSRILVHGGAGGTGGEPLAQSLGGKGSMGLVRVEQRGLGNGPDATTVAAITFPTDPMDPTSVKWLSTGDWIYNSATASVAESVTGSQSCWIQPPGAFFSLTFPSDPVAPATPASMSWNMDVILDLGSGNETVPYRGSDGNGPFMGMYPEEYWGTLLNRDLQLGEVSAPIVVRFQGAATSTTILDPCNVDFTNPLGPIKVGSVSPWVPNPADLNPYLPLPTVARFLILFDQSHPDFTMIKGVTNLRIEAQPE